MFDMWTVNRGIGLLAGLVIFLLVFAKWDFPGWLRRSLRLTNRLKALIVVLLLGTLLAACVMAVSQVLQLRQTPSEILEGFVMGFNCAIVVGLVRGTEKPRGGAGGAPQRNAKHQSTDNRGRRSKG
jgi:hypothetical protein